MISRTSAKHLTCDQYAHEFASHQLNFDTDELHMLLSNYALSSFSDQLLHTAYQEEFYSMYSTQQQNFHNEIVFYLGTV